MALIFNVKKGKQLIFWSGDLLYAIKAKLREVIRIFNINMRNILFRKWFFSITKRKLKYNRK